MKYTQFESSSDSDVSNLDVEIPPEITTNLYGLKENESERNEESKPKVEIPRTHVTVCDINQAMLDVGKERAVKANINSGSFVM